MEAPLIKKKNTKAQRKTIFKQRDLKVKAQWTSKEAIDISLELW